jgi:eukaryotic-like serine/threonine-protein kinase
MNNRDHREEELFDAARRIADSRERAAFLESTCAGDSTLCQRLRELLSAQASADDFFRLLPEQRASASASPFTEEAGTAIGRYRLLEKIGEGGFGAVHVAEQTEPVKRQVALKIIKAGMDTQQVVARFEAERRPSQ